MSISRSSIGLATSTQVVKKECFASILSEHRHFLKKCSWLYRSQWAAAVYQATCYSQYVAKKEFVELLCFQASSNALCMQNKKCALWWHFRWIYMVKTQIRSALLNSLGRRGGGGEGVWDDLSEILFHFFVREAIVSNSGMRRYVQFFKLSVQHFPCRLRRRPSSKVSWRMVLERLSWRLTCSNHANFRLLTAAWVHVDVWNPDFRKQKKMVEFRTAKSGHATVKSSNGSSLLVCFVLKIWGKSLQDHVQHFTFARRGSREPTWNLILLHTQSLVLRSK